MVSTLLVTRKNATYKLRSLRIRQNSAAIEDGARYQSPEDRWHFRKTVNISDVSVVLLSSVPKVLSSCCCIELQQLPNLVHGGVQRRETILRLSESQSGDDMQILLRLIRSLSWMVCGEMVRRSHIVPCELLFPRKTNTLLLRDISRNLCLLIIFIESLC